MAVAEAIEHSVHLVVNCSVPKFSKNEHFKRQKNSVIVTGSSIAKNHMSFEKKYLNFHLQLSVATAEAIFVAV